MLDIGWSELLIIGIVALIVVGPKELPVLLRVVGRYMGIIKRQADEFRSQFQEAMQQAELEQLRKDVTDIKAGAEDTLREVKQSFEDGLEVSPLKNEEATAGEGGNKLTRSLGNDQPGDNFPDSDHYATSADSRNVPPSTTLSQNSAESSLSADTAGQRSTDQVVAPARVAVEPAKTGA